MWIHTDQGFVSVVDEPERPADELLVRARSRDDLLRIGVPAEQVWFDARADYRWRARMPREWVADVMADAIRGINYRNFKNRVGSTIGGERVATLHDGWDAFFGIEQEPSVRKVDAAYLLSADDIRCERCGLDGTTLDDGLCEYCQLTAAGLLS
jgi:hypothetical protein